MEIINYKGIIIVDNFITPEENDTFVSLIEKPKCYENNTYWKYLGNENKVTPFALNYYDDNLYSSPLERIENVKVCNTYIDVKKRIQRLLEEKCKVEHSGLEKFADYVPYICDKEIPLNDVSLGIPSEIPNDHSKLVDNIENWGLTAGGTRKYVARIFINHDFTGGNLTFPYQKLDVQPLKDRLVLYPCSKEYVYGIRKIDGGSFYLTFWFNKA